VVVVALVITGAVLVTKSRSDDEAKVKTTSPVTTSVSQTPPPITPTTPTPSPTTPGPTVTMSMADALATAERAFPGFSNTYTTCIADDQGLFVEVDLQLSCSGKDGAYIRILLWRGTGSGYGPVREWFKNDPITEPTWAHGKDFQYDASGIYYQYIRCYSGVPVCIDAFKDTKAEAEAAINGVGYLDSAGIREFQTWLAGQPF